MDMMNKTEKLNRLQTSSRGSKIQINLIGRMFVMKVNM